MEIPKRKKEYKEQIETDRKLHKMVEEENVSMRKDRGARVTGTKG